MRSVHHPQKKDARASERLRLLTTRLRIYVWNTKNESDAAKGFGFVGDLSPGGIGIYLGEYLAPGTLVRLGFEHVDGTTYRGVVTWAGRYALEQRFVGHEALHFRVGVKCQFGSEAERQRYIAYQQELKERALVIKPEA